MRFSHAKLAGWLWASSVQYFIVQLVVISAWTVPHSWTNNFISDLGNTECGTYAGLAVCSPLHMLMNVSFVIYGLTIIGGTILLQRGFGRSLLNNIAFWFMILCGIGTIMVGLFPENTLGLMHSIGAFLALGVGNVAVLLIGLRLTRIPSWLRWYTVVSAVVSLGAFTLFLFDIYLGIGRGGMERMVSYPFTIWMIVTGMYLIHSRKTSAPPAKT